MNVNTYALRIERDENGVQGHVVSRKADRIIRFTSLAEMITVIRQEADVLRPADQDRLSSLLGTFRSQETETVVVEIDPVRQLVAS